VRRHLKAGLDRRCIAASFEAGRPTLDFNCRYFTIGKAIDAVRIR
jgi:hypothetical protein